MDELTCKSAFKIFNPKELGDRKSLGRKRIQLKLFSSFSISVFIFFNFVSVTPILKILVMYEEAYSNIIVR